MAVLVISNSSGDPAQLLERMQNVDEVLGPPARANGGVFRVIAKTDDGILIVSLWESEEGFEKYLSEPAVREARQAAGGESPGESSVYDILDYLPPT
jgi:quinol monooxygenase YgiN